MAVFEFLKGRALDAERIAVITTAFDAACRDLGLSDRRDPITEILALRIIEAAQTGECDPSVIRQKAMDSMAANRPL